MKMKTLLTSAAPPNKIISIPPHTQKPRRRFGSPENNIICRYDDAEDEPRHGLKRRQLLLASSVRVPAAGILSQPCDQVSNLTNYRKLEDAQKRKYKYGADIEVASSLFRASDPSNGVHDEFSGMVSVPSQHYHDFVETRVARPPSNHHSPGGEEEEELVIEGIKVRRERPFWFDVYIRPADVEAQDEYVGSFLHMPRHRKGQAKGLVKCCLRLGIGDMIDDVDPRQKKSVVVVTLVAKLASGHNSIDVDNIRIEHS